MKTVLCFGDSNTWGYMPGTAGRRYGCGVRWPGVMAKELGSGFRVVEEALNGRTTAFDDPIREGRNGSRMLGVVLESHTPIDVVVLMLGTNDLKRHLGLVAGDVALGMGRLIEMVKAAGCGPWVDGEGGTGAVGGEPRILVASPVVPVESDSRGPIDKFPDAGRRGAGLAAAYRKVAESLGCAFVDVGGQISVPDPDGVHLDADGHEKVGRVMAQAVRELVG